MKKRVLSISYDEALLKTRHYIFEKAGFEIVSALGYTEATSLYASEKFDVVVLGHTLPAKDKAALVSVLREACKCPVVSILRTGIPKDPDADYSVSADDGPEAIVATVRQALGIRD